MPEELLMEGNIFQKISVKLHEDIEIQMKKKEKSKHLS